MSGRGGGRLGGVRVEGLKFLGKFKQKKFGGGGVRGVGSGGGGVSGRGGGGLGVKVDVNEELKFLVKIHQKKFLGGSVAEGVRWGGSGWWRGGGQGGCERNVGDRGDVGYKKVLYNIKKMKNFFGGGEGEGGNI